MSAETLKEKKDGNEKIFEKNQKRLGALQPVHIR